MELAAEETYFGQSRPFKCVYVRCGRAFKTKTALEDHYRIHDGSRPYTCFLDTCGKQFGQFSSLQKHERIHRGERPYQCSECGIAFTQVSNLRRHERLHAGLKPHECNICSKPFSALSNLRQHMKTHENELQRAKFECSKCKKLYLYQSSLNKHLKNHEREGSAHSNDYLGQIPQISYKPSRSLYESTTFLEGSSPEKKLVIAGDSDSALILLSRLQNPKNLRRVYSAETLIQQLNLSYSHLGYAGSNPSSSQNISPIEVLNQDPQQDLNRELSHNALQDQSVSVQNEISSDPHEGSISLVSFANLEEDFDREFSPRNPLSIDAEEEDGKAELERLCDRMIQFDSNYNVPLIPNELDYDTLTVRLHGINSQQDYEDTDHTSQKRDIPDVFGYDNQRILANLDLFEDFSPFD